MLGLIDSMKHSWSRRVGRKIRNIKYTYTMLTNVLISFGIFVGLGFYVYFFGLNKLKRLVILLA